MEIWIIGVAGFIFAAGLVWGISLLVQGEGNAAAEKRLQTLVGAKGGADIETKGIIREDVFREGLNGMLGSLSGFMSRFKKFNLLFVQADAPITGQQFFLLTGGLAVVGIVGSAIGRAPIPLYPLVSLVLAALPLMWLLMRRKRRLKKFATQLPDALELLARALRSGHGLASAMKVVADEMPAPIATEFGLVYEAQNLNMPLDQALREMLKRIPNLDLKFFATAVVIQKQTGGDLAEILDKIGHIVRERFKILGQVQALTGEGRISGIVLMGLPIVLFFAVYYLNADYVMLLFTDDLGRKMIGVAIVLQILGAICIKKIVNIKV